MDCVVASAPNDGPDLILRSRALARRLEGWPRVPVLRRSFETHRFAMLLRMRSIMIALIWNCSGELLAIAEGTAHDTRHRLRQPKLLSQSRRRDRKASRRGAGGASALPDRGQGLDAD